MCGNCSHNHKCLHYLITFTVILKASGTLAVASFIVSSLITHNTFANFWSESVRISIKTGSYSSLPILFMLQVVIAVVTVAHIAEFTICKTITIPTHKTDRKISWWLSEPKYILILQYSPEN